MKYLPPARQIRLKIKSAQSLLKFGTLDNFKYGDLDFNVKNNFYEIFISWQAQVSLKIKNAQDLLKFGTFDILNTPISILKSKKSFIKHLPPVSRKLVPTLKAPKSAQSLLKFGTFDISSVSTSILMSNIIFMKHLPPVRPFSPLFLKRFVK